MTQDAVFDTLFIVLALKYCEHANNCYEQTSDGCGDCWKAKNTLSMLKERGMQ